MSKYTLHAHTLPHINLFGLDLPNFALQNFGGLEKTLRSMFRYTLAINIALALATLALLSFSLVSMNASTSAGHSMTLLQEQEKSLIEQNTALRAELANLQAMDAVEIRVQNLGLTKIAAIDYIKKMPSTLAYLK